MTSANKEMVIHFYDELFRHGNLAVIDRLIGPAYVNHNPHAPDGPEALRRFVTGFKAAHPRLNHTIARVIAEDDLVLLHTHAVLEPGTPGQMIVDIFRVRDEKIVEHWDVIQQVPDSTASGNDMFSTLSAPPLQSLDAAVSAAASKQVASTLFNALTFDRDLTAFDRYTTGSYYEHNPRAANGTAAAKALFSSTFATHPAFRISVKRVIAEGDHVAFHHHARFASDDRGVAVVDLFRVRDGKVVEHWDVVQPIPATAANNNSMF